MEGDERNKKKKLGNNVSNSSNLSKSLWVRYLGIQADTINDGLLDYNAYTICVCAPILYLIFYFI